VPPVPGDLALVAKVIDEDNILEAQVPPPGAARRASRSIGRTLA
jgi:hypothetical protein